MKTTTRTVSRAGSRVAALLGTMLLVAAGSLVATPSANAAGLECGQARISERSGRTATITHSCVGSGTVQYKLDCRLGYDVQFSVVYRAPGQSILRKVTCGTGYPAAIYFDIK